MQEIISQRRRDSKKFNTGRTQLNADGVTEDIVYASIFQNGLHDEEPDGTYVDVDVLSEPYEVGVSTDRIKRTRAGEIRYSDTGSPSKQLAKIKTKRGKGISLKLMGYTTYGPMWPTLREARYTTDSGIDISQVANYKGFNLTLEISNPQTSENVYRFSVKEYGCDYTYEEIDGKIKCESPDGKDNVWIKALPAIDSMGSQGSVTLRLGSVTAEGYQIIEKVIDPVWLGNAIGLVRVDPSVTIEDGVDSGVIEDNWMQSSVPDGNRGTITYLLFASYASSLVYVDLSAYSGVTPVSGKFLLTELDFDVVNCKAYKLKKSFGELTSSWNDRDTGIPWETAGAKGATDREAIEECSFTSSNVQYAVVDVPITVDTLTEWLTTNYGVVMERTGGDTQLDVGSAENGTYPIQFYFEYTEGGSIGFPFFFDIGHY